MQREVIKWLQSLDLSYPVKNPRKDFANGFTAAEIVSRYAGPQYITMHSIGTGVSSDCRRDNWVQVHHALQRLRCRTISMALIESILRYQPNAAQTVLENMYEFFSKRALPMRTIDADGTHFIKPKDALASAVLLETTGEVPAGAITGAVGNATNAEEEAREGYIVATTVQECLALTANDDLAGGVRPFQQPRYAAATASSLVRVANHDRQQLELQQPKASPDEEEQRMRNTQIIGQHGMIQKAMRMSEKKVVMEETTATGKKKLRPVPLTTILRGRYASATIYSQKREKRQKEAEVAVEQANDNTIGAQRVNVNVMNDTLKVALERNGIHLRSEERAGEKSIEFFEQCDFNLRKAFSSLLKDVLAAHHDLYTLVELSGNNSESDVLEDLFTSVVAHRDVLSLETLRACWTALEQNIAGIAASVHARGSEYSYLIQSMNFIFSLEAAQVPTLHVSSSPILKESGDESNPRPLSVSLGGRPHNSIQSDAAATNPLNRNISSGVQRHRSQSIGARPPSHRFFPERRTPELRRQQAVLLDRQAFNIASAFVLLSRIQETLARHHPADALQTLTAYFLPAAKLALVPFGTPAVVEAMTRVIVMSVCGTEQLQTKSEIFTLPDGCTADVDVVVDDDMLESKRWRQEARLARFLALVIRPFLIDSATTTGSLVVSPVDSKGSSYTQIVSPAASVELVSRKSSFYQRASTRPQASAPSIHSEQRYYLFMYHTLCHYQQIREEDESISLRHWQMQSAYPLAQLASNAVDQCLSRELPGTRAIGLGLLSWLMAADGWVHALRHLPRGVLEPVMTAVSGSDLRSSDARLWELRILALDLLTLLFQKWMIIHKEEHDYEMKRTEAAAVAEGAGSHMDYSHSSISNSREMGSAEVRRNTVAMEPPRCASSMLSQYERLSDAIAAVVSPMDLERATERTLSTFLHAPPSHRQLALTVIGSRLLPDEQPRVAKLWLRCLLAVPTKTLRLCLLPFEKEPLEMKVRSAPVNGMNPVVPVPASSPSKQGKGGSVVLPPISPNPNMSASIGHFNNTTATLGAGGSMTPVMLKVARAAVSGFAERSNMECSELSGEGSSSISFVVGKVEPSYKVAPLNQTWDTHSVVQVVLRNLRTIQPYQVLSTVAAALLSPQGLDVQHAQLLHNLSVSEGVTPSMVDTMERPSSHQRSSSQDGTKHDDLELEDDDLAVTLHDLVHTARVPDGSSMADSYTVPVRPTNESVEELSRCFWLSVLHRLLPIISTAIAPPPPPTKNNVEFPLDGTMSYLNRTDNTVTTASSHCFNDDVDPATLSEVAQAVLFTLFQRYAPEEEITAAVSDTREVLPRAFQWAQMTLDSA